MILAYFDYAKFIKTDFIQIFQHTVRDFDCFQSIGNSQSLLSRAATKERIQNRFAHFEYWYLAHSLIVTSAPADAETTLETVAGVDLLLLAEPRSPNTLRRSL